MRKKRNVVNENKDRQNDGLCRVAGRWLSYKMCVCGYVAHKMPCARRHKREKMVGGGASSNFHNLPFI